MNNSANFALNLSCPKRPSVYIPTTRLVIGHYVFPLLFIVGITGNILNLLVLNSKGMRTKTNVLLSAMAVADLCFFLVMIPTELQIFDSVASKDGYRSFLARNKMALTFFGNWFATASTWMALAVTAERVFAIKMPLHAKFYWKKKRVIILIIAVLIGSLFLHLYNLFWFRLIERHLFCSDGSFSYTAYILVPINQSESAYLYVQASRIFVPHLSITLPFFALFVLNGFLLYYVHENRRAMADATNAPQLRTNEMKVALMVALIVLTFILCSTPSVALYIYDAISTFVLRSSPYTVTFFNLSTLSNCLVVIGKASNFVLYCSASSHFRRRLVHLFCTGYGAPIRGSSRASTSQRRTTLTSLFAAAIAEFQSHRDPTDALCAIAAGAHSANRRQSSKSNGSIENIMEMTASPITKLTAKGNKVQNRKRKHGNVVDENRRHSSQCTQKRSIDYHKHKRLNPILRQPSDATTLLLQRRRFSSPDQ